MKKFVEGKLYAKYVDGYKVLYRITKRTYKKIYFMSISVELDKPISTFDANLICTTGIVDDIKKLFNEDSVSIEAASFWNDDCESFTVWNEQLGPIEVSSLNEV